DLYRSAIGGAVAIVVHALAGDARLDGAAHRTTTQWCHAEIVKLVGLVAHHTDSYLSVSVCGIRYRPEEMAIQITTDGRALECDGHGVPATRGGGGGRAAGKGGEDTAGRVRQDGPGTAVTDSQVISSLVRGWSGLRVNPPEHLRGSRLLPQHISLDAVVAP